MDRNELNKKSFQNGYAIHWHNLLIWKLGISTIIIQ